LVEVGCDPALVDPRRVLAAIAGDVDAPASARVAAAKALLDQRNPAGTTGKGKAEPKRVVAQRAAANAGEGTPWGDDLDWGSNGRRPQ
jgi:hypothetical protein